MDIKKTSIKIVMGILLAFCGLVMLLDHFDIAFNGAIKRWYLIAILYFACASLAIAVMRKAPLYYIISFTLAGLALSVELAVRIEGIEFWQVMMIIPTSIGLGIVLSELICKWSKSAVKNGFLLFLISGILLIGTITRTWTVILPCILIAIGILIVILSFANINKKSDKDDNDYYVTPTNKKDEDK